MGKGPLFLNSPIVSSGHDVVGVETYVEKLDMAIDAGAQMIAVTSPFGAGKSSVIELLQKRREEKRKEREYRRTHGKERFIEVSMWSHLGEVHEDSCAALHRTFVYQLASQIAPEKGTYVNRRLSRNYGLLRLYTNNRIYWLFALGAILLAAAWWALHTFDEQLKLLLPWLEGRTDKLSTILLFCAILFSLFILTRADILFSSNKSEGERIVEGDEIIDLYRCELLRPRCLHWNLWVRLRKGTHYIVVIEDLDRTDASAVILQFLKELRKYYVPEKTAVSYLNRVTFLVNIKPEAELLSSESASVPSETGSLYAKIFDYILSLRTINIDNYDTILNGLLAEHKEELQALGLPLPEGEAPSGLPGMQWIIRERKLGIREIKERLNIAFSLFESLRRKFPSGGTAFEKCAAVAYLVTAFEADFCKTSDRAFQELVELYLKETSERPFSSAAADYQRALSDTSEEYQKAVWELIHAKLIDSSYRSYFYNYPQESYFYSSDESAVMNAILYGETFPELKSTAATLVQANSPVIEDAYRKIKQLGILLPGFVLSVEPLFVTAVRVCFDSVLDRLANLDYSQEATQKNLRLFRELLSFDSGRQVLSERHAGEICALWEREMDESSLLQLRKMLCETFPREIGWYHALFSGVHNIITIEEMDQLSFLDALKQIDQQNENFSEKESSYIVERFSGLREQERADAAEETEAFLRKALAVLGIEKAAKPLIQFMCVCGRIISDFESAVGDLIADDPERYEETLFPLYQALINQTAPQGFGKETARRISRIDRYDGYTPETANCLLENSFSMDYVLLTLSQGLIISYEKDGIINAIQKNESWLFQKHPDLFERLRFDIVNTTPAALDRYGFLFTEERPIMSRRELHALEGQKGDIESNVISLIPAAKVTPEEAEPLRDFFCRKKQTAASTMSILHFVGQLNGETARALFFKLDFSKIQYRSLGEKRKLAVKRELSETLELEQPENKLKFMKATQYLDPVWERELLPELKEDRNLQRAYVAAVNSCEKLSGETIEIITNLGVIYATAPHVTERAFQAKKYFWYTTSKIQWDDKFVMEDGERGDLLWRTYLDIFGTARDENWNSIKRAMRKNKDFLYKIMETEVYKNFDDESRMGLTGVLQSAACIREAVERGSQFALRYCREISGFQDWEAANAFVELVSKDPVLLASEELYEHTHDRLVNGALKGKYTNRRKRL